MKQSKIMIWVSNNWNKKVFYFWYDTTSKCSNHERRYETRNGPSSSPREFNSHVLLWSIMFLFLIEINSFLLIRTWLFHNIAFKCNSNLIEHFEYSTMFFLSLSCTLALSISFSILSHILITIWAYIKNNNYYDC